VPSFEFIHFNTVYYSTLVEADDMDAAWAKWETMSQEEKAESSEIDRVEEGFVSNVRSLDGPTGEIAGIRL